MSQRKHGAASLLTAVGTIAVVAAVGVVIFAALPDAPPTDAAAPAPEATSVRTVLVSDTPIDFVSQPRGDVRVFLAEGDMPSPGRMATVLTDENCAPDERGVSHCLNELEVDGGPVLQVIHHHRMSDVPCLSPGERVMIEPVL